MGNVTLSPPEILTAIAGAAAIVTAVFHGALYIGRLTVRLDDHGRVLKAHEARIDDHDREFRFLKGL